MDLFSILLPELIVTATALVLFMFGVAKSAASRRVAPWVAMAGLLAALLAVMAGPGTVEAGAAGRLDWTGAIISNDFSWFVKVLALGVGSLFVLLSWPTNDDATGNTALRFGEDAGEFFGLILLSLVGLMLVGQAGDTIMLFMAIELASIPTYILVSTSRPLPAAQEAGLKYFYLGAMTAAIMLLGFAYLYGVTGTTNLLEMGQIFAGQSRGPGEEMLAGSGWQTAAVVLVLLGFCFKLAAVPLHFYAGDVYEGAATPVTALLSFVPKAVGILAMVKILFAVGGNGFYLTPTVWKVLFVIAILTMTFGNTLALLARNLKRVMAYSSIAHSGYMLVALAVLSAGSAFAGNPTSARGLASVLGAGDEAMSGLLFYLTAYGIMNAGVFGVLMMLPSRRRIPDNTGALRRLPATSAEDYDDIAGTARRFPLLGVAMAICCISLIGIPLTVGFLAKFYIIRPALLLAGNSQITSAGQTALYWLVGLTLINAVIGAAYYLRIITTMTLTPSPDEEDAEAGGQVYEPAPAPRMPRPIALATGLSVAGTLLFGIIPPFISMLNTATTSAANSVFDSEKFAIDPVPPTDADESVAAATDLP